MNINQATDNMMKANAALSKLNTFLEMLKITSAHMGENPKKLPTIEWMDVTDMLIEQTKDIATAMQDVEGALLGLRPAIEKP